MLDVSVVDSQPVYARGLVAILGSDAGINVVESVGALADVTVGVVPDGGRVRRVVIVDADLVLGPTGERRLQLLARRDAVLLTARPEAVTPAHRLGALGVAGYVDRLAAAEEVLSAVHAVASGRRYASPALAVDLPEDGPPGRQGAEPATGELSPREYQVLQYIAVGRTHDQIARRLGISRHTVDTYVKRIRAKLRLGNKAELTRAALLEVPVRRAG
jgi:DNA-binding NarL/FixJ family response regulator